MMSCSTRAVRSVTGAGGTSNEFVAVFPVDGLVYPVKDQRVLVGDAACRTGRDEPEGMERLNRPILPDARRSRYRARG